MKKELFSLKRFKMKGNQDVELGYKYNAKLYDKVTFSEPVHPDLSKKFDRLEGVFGQITGIVSDPENEKSKVVNVEVRGVYIFEGSDNKNFMVSAVVEFLGGLKTNINTPKYSCEMYNELFVKSTEDLNISAFLVDFENEVFELVNNKKTAQGTLFPIDNQDENE